MSDSSESDISSSYSSDGEILTLLKRTSVTPPSSDDSDQSSGRRTTDPSSPDPVDSISDGERTDILNILSSGQDQNNFQIFPNAVRQHLARGHAHIISRLRELPRRGNSVVIASRSLLSVIEGAAWEKPAPKDVLFDVCVFSPTEPVLVLTITSGGGKKDRITRYNSELTKQINQSVTRRTRHSFSAVYGVVDESMCRRQDTFVSKVKRLESDTLVMSLHQDLVMTQTKCLDVVKSFLQLLPVVAASASPQASASEEDKHSDTISQRNYEALIRRIEQLEIAQTDARKEKEDMALKYDRVLNELSNIKQDYLTDIRLSLLMRPRSSSISESTVSGYGGSTDVDSDVPDRQEAVMADSKPHRTGGKDDHPSQLHPQLTTEVIRTGDLELVQYNRDITLHQACGEGKLDVVKYVLSQGVADINCRQGKWGRTPVMAAVVNGQMAVFDYLVSQDCDLSAGDNTKDTVLHWACIGGNTDIVRKLVDSGKCEIECRGYLGRTPVMTAAVQGYRGVFDLLVSRGCNLTEVDDQGSTILHVACIGGNVDMVKYMLTLEGVSIESRGYVGRTPVMTAAAEGHRGVFDLLVSRGCNLTAVDDQGSTILHVACIGGNVDMVKYLLTLEGVSIESRGYVGRTPVMEAAAQGHRGVFDLLVSRGCNLTAVDDQGSTILHMACIGGNVDMVKYLLTLEVVSIESRGYGGRTPVMLAAAQGHRGVFDLLVSRGCNLTAVVDKGNTILHVACIGGNVDIVKYLLTLEGVSIESRGYVGRTPVMTAAAQGHRGVFDLLVSEGCNLTAVNNEGDTILHVACIGGNVDIVKYLLTLEGVSIESRGFLGRTPVMLAAAQGLRGVFDILVSRGCNLTAVDDQGNTILHVACIGGNVDMVKYLLTLEGVSIESRGYVGRTPVMLAASQGLRELFDLLVSRGCNLTAVNNDGNNILHYACYGGNVDMVKYLLTLEGVSIESRGYLGRTPVMTAAAEGHRGVFDLLVSRGCNLTEVDDQGSTILHVACVGGNVDMVKYLLTLEGVSIESRGYLGRTPVMTAAGQGHRGVFDLLVSRSCNLTAVDNDGNNILHYACYDGNVDMVKYLLTLGVVGEKEKNKHGRTPVQVADRKGHGAVVSLLKAWK